MAITEQLLLDLTRAQQQIRDLDSEIDSLLQPVTVPVDIDAGAAVSELRRDLSQVDATIDLDVDGLAEVGRARREAGILADEFSDARREADRVADEARRIKTEVNQANTGLGGFAAGARTLVTTLAAFQGFRTAFNFLSEGVQDSAALAESLNRVNVLFGELSDDVVRFSQNSTAALVLTQREALDAVATFGGLADVVGLTREQSVEFGTTLTDLSADLASFGDTSVEDAIQAVGSALRGESEPIRRYNVLLNEAAVNAKALELGLADTTTGIDEAAKVQARYALILEQTERAQGDLLATQDSLGNRLKAARVDFENLRRELGEAVLPAVEGFLEAAPDLVDAVQALAPALSDAASAAGELAGPLATVTRFLTLNQGGIAGLARVFQEAGEESDTLGGRLAAAVDDILSVQSAASLAADAIGDYRQEASQVNALADLTDNVSPGFENQARAAITAAGGISEYLAARDGLRDLDDSFAANEVRRFRAIRDAVEETIPELAALSEELATVLTSNVNPFATLEANFSAGAQAFNELIDDETGEIVGSLEEFVAELTEQIAAQTDFDANLAELGRRGFDALADLFRTEGPATARLAAEALNDPQAAAEAEAQLEGTARSQADAFLQAYGQAFAQGDISQDYIQQLTELADAAQSGTVQNALIAAAKDLALLFAANFNPQILIDDFNISLPSNVVAANVGGDLLGSGTPSTATSSGAQFGTQVININNATTEDVETSAAQAAQTLGAISGLVN